MGEWAPAYEGRRAGGGFMEAKIGSVEANHGRHRSLKFKFAIPWQILKVHHAVRRWWDRRPRNLRLGTGCHGVEGVLTQFGHAPPAHSIQASSILRGHANCLGARRRPGRSGRFIRERTWKMLGYFKQYVNAGFGRLPRGSALAIGGPGSKRSAPALRRVRWAANDLDRAGLARAL